MRALTERAEYITVTIWESGRAYGHREIVDAIEEAAAVPVRLPRARTWEEQVAARRAELDACARAYYERTGRQEHHGGPVAPW